MMPEIADAANISSTGEIFVEERAIIYDMANGKMAKRKNGRGKIAKGDNDSSEAQMESKSSEARDEE
jgi:hypothetical protein